MRRLFEWLDANGNKINIPSAPTVSTSTTTSSSSGFKKRLEKLINYHIKHKPPMVIKHKVRTLVDDCLAYTEIIQPNPSVNEVNLEYFIYIEEEPKADWRLRIKRNDRVIVDNRDSGWENLLDLLDMYLVLPTHNSQEYNELLTEWLDAKGNNIILNNNSSSTPSSSSSSSTSTKTNKAKFTSLIYYMKKNKCISVTDVKVEKIEDNGFIYKESRISPAKQDYILTVSLSHSKVNSLWILEIYLDDDLIDKTQGKGWEDLLRALRAYVEVPEYGTQEYLDLCESVSFAEDFRLYEELWD